MSGWVGSWVSSRGGGRMRGGVGSRMRCRKLGRFSGRGECWSTGWARRRSQTRLNRRFG